MDENSQDVKRGFGIVFIFKYFIEHKKKKKQYTDIIKTTIIYGKYIIQVTWIVQL